MLKNLSSNIANWSYFRLVARKGRLIGKLFSSQPKTPYWTLSPYIWQTHKKGVFDEEKVIENSQQHTAIPIICQFWYTNALFRPVLTNISSAHDFVMIVLKFRQSIFCLLSHSGANNDKNKSKNARKPANKPFRDWNNIKTTFSSFKQSSKSNHYLFRDHYR